MKFGVSFITCGRIQLTRKVGDSTLRHNPVLAQYPWMVSDDNSQPCVKNYFDDLAKDYILDLHYVWNDKREGANLTSRNMFEWAKANDIDVLLVLVNDFECTRTIDVPAVIKFFEERDDVGQVQMFHWKGKIGDKERERSLENWITHEPIKVFEKAKAGKEELWGANWLWTDGVNFTRVVKDVDYFEGTIGVPKDPAYILKSELMKARNFMKTDLKIYEMQDQPFFNLDWDFNSQTPGKIP